MNMEIYFEPKTDVNIYQEETLNKRDEKRTTIAVMWVVTMLCARQVPVSNLALGTGYPDRDFSLFPQSTSIPDLYLISGAESIHPPIHTNPRHHYNHLTKYRR